MEHCLADLLKALTININSVVNGETNNVIVRLYCFRDAGLLRYVQQSRELSGSVSPFTSLYSSQKWFIGQSSIISTFKQR